MEYHVKLNVDEKPVSAANYGIKRIPTMILFNKGQEVERIVGVTGKESIGRLIEKHARLEAPKHKAAQQAMQDELMKRWVVVTGLHNLGALKWFRLWRDEQGAFYSNDSRNEG